MMTNKLAPQGTAVGTAGAEKPGRSSEIVETPVGPIVVTWPGDKTLAEVGFQLIQSAHRFMRVAHGGSIPRVVKHGKPQDTQRSNVSGGGAA